MGRNGKSSPVFTQMVNIINQNVGKTIDKELIMLGREFGRNSVSAYLYKFVKAGYITPIGGKLKDAGTKLKIEHQLDNDYKSMALMDELKAIDENRRQ